MNDLNLKPPRSAAEAREMGRKGGKASGAARREKKLLSARYANMLATEYGLASGGLTLEQVVTAILARCDASSVSMLKEIREATEGSKVGLLGPISIGLPNDPSMMTPEQRKARIAELTQEKKD